MSSFYPDESTLTVVNAPVWVVAAEAGNLFTLEFIHTLQESPETALRNIGVEPTPEVLEALAKIDKESLITLLDHFGRHPYAEATMP